MSTGLPFPLEIALLILGLPLAIAWLMALVGVASLPLRTVVKKLRTLSRFRSTLSSGR